jgi:CubicO group peptidase (beta-lactamase class C family)
MLQSHPNPALTVGADNKQGWNQPAGRRHGFHNAHLLFRRTMTVRSRRVLDLIPTDDPALTARVTDSGLTTLLPFSALVVAQGNALLHASAAPDFATDRPHSVQSISKMHIHLIIGELVAAGRLNLSDRIGTLLPWVGTAYDRATLQDVLDMNVENDFSEDYADPFAGCYAEEQAIAFRLPPDSQAEPTLHDFVASLTGTDLTNRTGWAQYKSANTDLLTLLAAAHVNLPARMEAIADAAGYEGALHMALSPDLHPAFSGGGCLSGRDLARFGLLLARRGKAVFGPTVGSAAFTDAALTRPTLKLGPKRGAVRYANHVMTNGRWIGHGGYGGQFLMVDMETGRVAVFFSVLENDSGYDTDYMADVVARMERVICT